MAVFIIFSFICSLEWAPDVGSNVRFKTNKPVIYLLFTQSTSLNSNSRSFINFGPSYGTLREILYIGVYRTVWQQVQGLIQLESEQTLWFFSLVGPTFIGYRPYDMVRIIRLWCRLFKMDQLSAKQWLF